MIVFPGCSRIIWLCFPAKDDRIRTVQCPFHDPVHLHTEDLAHIIGLFKDLFQIQTLAERELLTEPLDISCLILPSQ